MFNKFAFTLFGTQNQVNRHDGISLIVDLRAFSVMKQGTMMKFSKNLATWAAQEGVKEVIILSGLDSGKVQRSETNAYVMPSC